MLMAKIQKREIKKKTTKAIMAKRVINRRYKLTQKKQNAINVTTKEIQGMMLIWLNHRLCTILK